MKTKKRIATGLAGAALVLGVGTGVATAATHATKDDGSSTTPPAGQPAGHPGGPPGAAAIASYLGLSVTQVGSDLKSGETLAAIATAQGKTVSGLEAAIVADATTHLDQAVTDGNLTAAQEATQLADLQSHVDDIVNSTGPPAGKGGPGGPGGPGAGPMGAGPQGSSSSSSDTNSVRR